MYKRAYWVITVGAVTLIIPQSLVESCYCCICRRGKWKHGQMGARIHGYINKAHAHTLLLMMSPLVEFFHGWFQTLFQGNHSNFSF